MKNNILVIEKLTARIAVCEGQIENAIRMSEMFPDDTLLQESCNERLALAKGEIAGLQLAIAELKSK